jgi:hypothetical protein
MNLSNREQIKYPEIKNNKQKDWTRIKYQMKSLETLNATIASLMLKKPRITAHSKVQFFILTFPITKFSILSPLLSWLQQCPM